MVATIEAGCCCWSGPDYCACLGMQYFSMKDFLMGGQMSFVGITSTPQNWQRPMIKVENPSALLDFSGSTGCLGGAILEN